MDPDAARMIATLAWAAFFVYWWLAAKSASTAVEHEGGWGRAVHLLFFASAFALAIAPMLTLGVPTFEAPRAGLAALLAGIGFAIWARVALGKHWSGTITLKEGHELVQRGPYALARHPIYTGLLLAFAGNAFVVGDVRGWIAFALALAAVIVKIPREERFMERAFGDAWVSYKKRVRAIVPFIL